MAGKHMIDRAAWDARVAHWRLAVVLRDADQKFGAYAKSSQTFEEESYRLKREYGGWERAQATKEGKERAKRIFASQMAGERAWYSKFVEPADDAAIALMTTPAPDVTALSLKVEVAEAHELDNHAGMPAEPIEIIRQDARRLAATARRVRS